MPSTQAATPPVQTDPSAPVDLDTLHERQQALELIITLLVAQGPRIDNTIDVLERLRDWTNARTPPRKVQADVIDGIVRMVRGVKAEQGTRTHG